MNEYLSVIADAMGRNSADIKDMIPLKKGMTNRSYIFSIDNKQYILRVPGQGTEKIIDRQNECDVAKMSYISQRRTVIKYPSTGQMQFLVIHLTLTMPERVWCFYEKFTRRNFQ